MIKKLLQTQAGQNLLALLSFVLIGLFYFAPILSGYDLRLGDVDNARGMSDFLVFYKETIGQMACWSPNTFLGMPAYMIYYPNDYFFTNAIASSFFNLLGYGLGGFLVMCFGFFSLLRSFQFKTLYAFGGALFFAFSGYFIVVLSAGHFNKIYAVGAFPFLFAGFVHLMNGRNNKGYLGISGGGLLALLSNHPQIFYYYSWILGLYLAYELFTQYKKGTIKNRLRPLIISIPLILISVFAVFESYYNTYNYSKKSIRGVNDIAKFDDTSQVKDGLDLGYITQWSYGIEESWNLIIPGFKGGGSGAIGARSETKNVSPRFKQNIESSSLYWGNQPFTAGPTYIGIVVFILFVLGMIFIKSKLKWVFFGVSVLALMLAWGKNFMGLTEFFVNYFPLYKKFRAVTMAHTIFEFCLPLISVWFIHDLFTGKIEVNKKQILKIGGAIIGGLLLFYFGGGQLFDFISDREQQGFVSQASSSAQMAGIIDQFSKELSDVRLAIFKSDVLRALLYSILTLGGIFLFITNKIKGQVAAIIVIGLGVIDLMQADSRVLSTQKINGQYRNFDKPEDKNHVVFQPTTADLQILQNELKQDPNLSSLLQKVQLSDDEKKSKGKKEQLKIKRQLQTLALNTNYRVLNLASGTFTDARTSYYHKSVGGYHAAKLRKAQNLYDVHFGKTGFHPEILKTLNVKYIINPSGLSLNPDNYGPIWPIKSLLAKENQADILNEMNNSDLSKWAYITTDSELNDGGVYDTLRTAEIKQYSPDSISYKIGKGGSSFFVLSEMYYPEGWTATFDGEKVSIHNVNYWMRGVQIKKKKAGTLSLKYSPPHHNSIRYVSLAGNILALLTILGLMLNQLIWKKEL
jgi:hypothetical protein